MDPRLTSVTSSNIAGYGYVRNTQTLVIEFIKGTLYAYDKVPEDVVADFKAAPSKGGFLNQVIKNDFPFREIESSDLDVLLQSQMPPPAAPAVKSKPRVTLKEFIDTYAFLRYVF